MVKLIETPINESVRDESRKRRLKQIRKAAVKLIDLKSNSVAFTTSKSPFHSTTLRCPTQEIQKPTTTKTTVIADLDAHTPVTQAQIAHLKRAGGIEQKFTAQINLPAKT